MDFPDAAICNAQEQRAHAPATLTCPDCPPGKNGEKRRYNEATLRDHKSTVHNKRHKCPKCEWANSNPMDLVTHFWTKHLIYQRYQCSRCGKQFGKEINAKYHFQSVYEKNTD